LLSQPSLSQKNPYAKNLYQLAVTDTTNHKDSLAAIHFFEAAFEEIKVPNPDFSFAGNSFLLAGQYFFSSKNYAQAHNAYIHQLTNTGKSNMQKEYLMSLVI
jgi:hypothetical protein